jgi:hypothetical protein
MPDSYHTRKMTVYPLIDPDDVYQTGLGTPMRQPPVHRRAVDGVKAVVIRVFPVGHPENRLGQTLVDAQPMAELPMLFRVPVCLPHAHQETEVALPRSPRRQPYDPKKVNRIEGSARDLRPGTYVWIQFLGGSLHDPVVVATMKPNRQGERPGERQCVDRIGTDGALARAEVVPLDSDLEEYPRSVDVFNGCRDEIDNRGNRYIQTSTDRDPVHPGHNGIPRSPDPQGNYGVSTRGAVDGHISFTSGKDPDTGDDSRGRHVRRSVDALDGSIRDSTRSTIGNIIRGLRSGSGRIWESTRGSGDGRIYHEDNQDNYLALGPRAELHSEEAAVLDGPEVHLGHYGAEYGVVLWPQLVEVLAAIFVIFDEHRHDGVETGDGTTAPPTTQQSPTWISRADECRSNVVTADKDPSPNPTFQDDPEA